MLENRLSYYYIPFRIISMPKNRYIQINLETLGGLKIYSQTSFVNRLTEGNTPYNCNALARKRLYSLDRDNMDPKTGLQRFRLPKAIKSRVRVYKYIRTKYGSLQRFYKKTYQLRLGIKDQVAAAKRRDPLSNIITIRSKRKYPLLNLVIVWSFLRPNVKEKLCKF